MHKMPTIPLLMLIAAECLTIHSLEYDNCTTYWSGDHILEANEFVNLGKIEMDDGVE